ncbi:cytidylyltransferase domain-containing protein [Nitrincola nitratireducens]|nr:acylneuraminate cytidylyltransferase family protein [Nitrincola nitratireducens]
MNIAVIPARGGSKRLPGKNIREIAGKPMIAWSIEAAIDSKVFDRVIVSTDDENIANISLQHGAEVPFLRPFELATDTATTKDVIEHLIKWLKNKQNVDVEILGILQPTSPLRTAADIQKSYAEMINKSASSVISVCQLEHPLEFCNKIPLSGSMKGFIDSKKTRRSQDYEIYYRINGAIYLIDMRKSGFDGLYSDGSFSYVMSTNRSVDIDTEDDFFIAKCLLENKV